MEQNMKKQQVLKFQSMTEEQKIALAIIIAFDAIPGERTKEVRVSVFDRKSIIFDGSSDVILSISASQNGIRYSSELIYNTFGDDIVKAKTYLLGSIKEVAKMLMPEYMVIIKNNRFLFIND